MITSEQSRKFGEFLNGKNLPLDLKVEILDHISEQMNYKTEVEGKDFGMAFSEVKESWKADLVMKKRFYFWPSITKIHRETAYNSDIEIFKKASLTFGIYCIISTALIFYSKTAASNFIFSVNLIITVVFAILLISNFKILKSTFPTRAKRNISFVQNGGNNLILCTLWIGNFVLYNFNERFEKYYIAIHKIIFDGSINFEAIQAVTIFNIFVFGWIYGFLYFLEYKKSLKILEQKINFKL